MTTAELLQTLNDCELQSFSKKASIVNGAIVQKGGANTSFKDPETGKRHWLNSKNIGTREEPNWKLEQGGELTKQ